MTLSAEDRTKLISLAREAVEAEVCQTAPPQAKSLEGVLAERRGMFVTLTNRGRLRGCIGTFQSQEPLGRTIVEMGRAAAHDPRFVTDCITQAELSELTVEVSVLSPLTETHQPEQLQIGTHGIYIVGRGLAGCFLPEVATEAGWTAEEFLSHCCEGKAGLAPHAWKDPDTKVYLFTSEKFDH